MEVESKSVKTPRDGRFSSWKDFSNDFKLMLQNYTVYCEKDNTPFFIIWTKNRTWYSNSREQGLWNQLFSLKHPHVPGV